MFRFSIAAEIVCDACGKSRKANLIAVAGTESGGLHIPDGVKFPKGWEIHQNRFYKRLLLCKKCLSAAQDA